jgi:nitroreductase
MDVREAIEKRRAYRSLAKTRITAAEIKQLGEAARLCCSAENHQPWRFVFVTKPALIKSLSTTMIKSNAWADQASMFVAVCTELRLDVTVNDRDIAPQVPGAGKLAWNGNSRPYSYFDTGQAMAFLILRATEMGLVAHPIAGYLEQRVQKLLHIPRRLIVMALVVVGRRAATIDPSLPPDLKADERRRPTRLPLSRISFLDRFQGPVAVAERRRILKNR